VLQYQAGADRMNKSDIQKLYKEPVRVDNLYVYLQGSGYINKSGQVQEKLANLKSSFDLVLSEVFEEDHARIFKFLEPYTYRLPFPKAVYYAIVFVLWIVGMLMSVGWIKMSLMLSRDQAADVSELFSNASLLIPYVLASICCGLAVLGGFILLIVPGIIFVVALSMYVFFIVDQNMGPIESLKASRALTKGVRWQLFLFGCLICLFNVAGFLCLIAGLLFTIPASAIAGAYVYDQLRQQGETAGVQQN
jgi:hypothetical protein